MSLARGVSGSIGIDEMEEGNYTSSSGRYQYLDDFTAKKLPLDADFDAQVSYIGPLYKHGYVITKDECVNNSQ
jgi:hypothetical protein